MFGRLPSAASADNAAAEVKTDARSRDTNIGSLDTHMDYSFINGGRSNFPKLDPNR